jgi:hypothetical protein
VRATFSVVVGEDFAKYETVAPVATKVAVPTTAPAIFVAAVFLISPVTPSKKLMFISSGRGLQQ